LKGGDILKSKEVLSLLRISRPTLTKYVKNGVIKEVIADDANESDDG